MKVYLLYHESDSFAKLKNFLTKSETRFNVREGNLYLIIIENSYRRIWKIIALNGELVII